MEVVAKQHQLGRHLWHQCLLSDAMYNTLNFVQCSCRSHEYAPPSLSILSSLQVILTLFISYIVDTFVSQYRLSEKLRETLKRDQEKRQPEEGLIAFCTKQTLSGLWVGAHSPQCVPVTQDT